MTTYDPDIMIAADNLTKYYGPSPAIREISFTCRKGEIVGFLGPNGAGKTTTMRILTGYMPPTSGQAFVAGHDTLADSIAARRRLGYLPETVPLYPEMTVEGYLAFMGRIRRIDDLWDRVDDVLESVDLLDRAESRIRSLSKGMRQRVGLAQAMLHDPDVLILDEPTIGLDPAQVVEVRELIRALGERHTILLSTHILSEVEQLCDRVIMIIDGRIWSDMPMDALLSDDSPQRVQLTLRSPTRDTAKILSNLVGVSRAARGGNRDFLVTYDGREETRAAIAATAVNAGWELLTISAERPTLEAMFLDKLRQAELARTDTGAASAEEEE